jgi:hypothetical protein
VDEYTLLPSGEKTGIETANISEHEICMRLATRVGTRLIC